MSKTALITGITGQDGAYLAQFLLNKGYNVVGLARSYNQDNIRGLKYLGIENEVTIRECDLLDLSNIITIFNEFKPDEIYNLASQSSVGLSFSQPAGTINFNIISVINILEAIRTVSQHSRFYQASSSEMFGNVENLPLYEYTKIHPTSPYAISKAAAHWSVINYRESYGIFASCGILFNHESYLRSPNFFVKKVIAQALKIKNGEQKTLKVGNLDIKRDFGYAPDYVKAMWLMLQNDSAKDYVICSGKSIYLRDIVNYVFDKLKIDRNKIEVDRKLFRPNEIQNIYGNNEKAKRELGWEYNKNFFEVLDILIEEELHNGQDVKSISDVAVLANER